jgi:hypothetical protein
MLPIVLGWVAAHQGEADPDLLEWIKERLDHLLGMEPWLIVTLLGLLVLAVPLSIVAFYLTQRRRAGSPSDKCGAFSTRQSPGRPS